MAIVIDFNTNTKTKKEQPKKEDPFASIYRIIDEMKEAIEEEKKALEKEIQRKTEAKKSLYLNFYGSKIN